jgi:hypothetical protein
MDGMIYLDDWMDGMIYLDDWMDGMIYLGYRIDGMIYLYCWITSNDIECQDLSSKFQFKTISQITNA